MPFKKKLKNIYIAPSIDVPDVIMDLGPYHPPHPMTLPPTPPHAIHTFPHIPTHIPQCLSCYFTPLPTHTHPTPPMPSHTSLNLSPNVCHVTSHHPPHPTQAHTPHPTPATHAIPCIPTLPYPTLEYF